MDFRIIFIPPFRAASSGVDKQMDFSPNSILGKFNMYFSSLEPSNQDLFMPRDFLFYDPMEQGLVWWYALCDNIDPGNHEVIDFDGGYYLTYVYKDGDDEEGGKRYTEAMHFIQSSDLFELDERPNHYSMGHIITPAEIIEKQGWAQMETFIPIKLRK